MTEEEICELYLNPDKGNNYISKDKIRDKIKENREKRNKLANGNFYEREENSREDYILAIATATLNSLLEE